MNGLLNLGFNAANPFEMEQWIQQQALLQPPAAPQPVVQQPAPQPQPQQPQQQQQQPGGFLNRIGDALIGMGDPYGMVDKGSLSPEQRQQMIGQTLLQLGTGIASSSARNPLTAVGQGFQYAQQQGQQTGESRMRGELFRQQIDERRRKAAAQQKISEIMADPNRRGELPAALAELDAGAAVNHMLGREDKADQRAWQDKRDAEDRNFRMQLQGMNFAQQRQLLELKNQMEQAGGGRFSNQPIYVTDDQGNTRVMQLNQNGKAILTQMPEGVKVAPNLNKVDIGTGTVLVDPRTGQVQNTIAKDVAGAEAQKKIGEAQGQNTVQAPNALAKGEQTLQLIEKIRNHPGLSGAVGWEVNLPDMLTAPAGSQTRNFITLLEQAQGQQFLQAFETLKGGGQITQPEGEKATQAIARMQRAQSEESFHQALKDYEDVVRAGMERMRRGVVASPPGGAGGSQPPKATPPASLDDLLNRYAPR